MINFFFLIFFIVYLGLGWFRCIFLESEAGFHSFKVVEGLKLRFIFFVFSELIFFFGIFWFFFDRILVPVIDCGFYIIPLGILLV